MEIEDTDTLLVHSNFASDIGFRGTPQDLVNALVDVVAAGNLLMLSIPYRGSACDFTISEDHHENVARDDDRHQWMEYFLLKYPSVRIFLTSLKPAASMPFRAGGLKVFTTLTSFL
jgi:aminoglycoside N3'-acetyltransferase